MAEEEDLRWKFAFGKITEEGFAENGETKWLDIYGIWDLL